MWTKKADKKIVNLRKVSELPYQQTYGEMWNEVEKTLCNLHFIEAKCAAGMTYDLVHDCNTALNSLPEAQEEKQKRLKHEGRLKKYTKDLISYARGETEHLDIIPSVEPWSEEKIEIDTERIMSNPTRLDRMRAFSQFVSSEGYALVKFASYPGFYIQQAYNSASSGPIASAAESIVNSKMDDLLILQLPSQLPDCNPHLALLKTLEGHTHSVNSVSITPDGKKAVSGGDTTLRFWDVESGKCLKILEGHTNSVMSVSITPDGKKALSGSYDNTLRLWDLESGKCLAIYQARGEITLVSEIRAGRYFVCGTYEGEVMIFTLRNFPIEPPIVTPIRIWHYGNKTRLFRNNGSWEDSIKALCLWCGQRFPVSREILNVITAIACGNNLSSHQSPCIELPTKVWEDPRLLSECPLCHKQLRFNPFIVGNRGRY